MKHNAHRFSFEFVRDTAKARGDTLLSTEYQSKMNALLFQCPVGHKFEMTFSRYRQPPKNTPDNKTRCKLCTHCNINWSNLEKSILESLVGYHPFNKVVQYYNQRIVKLGLPTRTTSAIRSMVMEEISNTIKPEFDYHNPSELANILGISKSAIHYWIKAKDLPIVKCKAYFYINHESFARWIVKHPHILNNLSQSARDWIFDYTPKVRFSWADIIFEEADLKAMEEGKLIDPRPVKQAAKLIYNSKRKRESE